MINEIVGLMCKEARSRGEESFSRNLIDVMFDVNREVIDVLDRLRPDGRRNEEDEN